MVMRRCSLLFAAAVLVVTACSDPAAPRLPGDEDPAEKQKTPDSTGFVPAIVTPAILV